jgi:hypothetical protein
LDAESTWPTVAWPVTTGATVFTGGLPGWGTTPVAVEEAELEPDPFVPVTTTTSVKPTSLDATVYEAEVAPPIDAQF